MSPIFDDLKAALTPASVAFVGTKTIADTAAECFDMDALVLSGEVCFAETGVVLKMNMDRSRPEPRQWSIDAVGVGAAPANNQWTLPMVGGIDTLPLSVKDVPIADVLFPDLPIVREFLGAADARFASAQGQATP